MGAPLDVRQQTRRQEQPARHFGQNRRKPCRQRLALPRKARVALFQKPRRAKQRVRLAHILWQSGIDQPFAQTTGRHDDRGWSMVLNQGGQDLGSRRNSRTSSQST